MTMLYKEVIYVTKRLKDKVCCLAPIIDKIFSLGLSQSADAEVKTPASVGPHQHCVPGHFFFRVRVLASICFYLVIKAPCTFMVRVFFFF